MNSAGERENDSALQHPPDREARFVLTMLLRSTQGFLQDRPCPHAIAGQDRRIRGSVTLRGMGNSIPLYFVLPAPRAEWILGFVSGNGIIASV